jgi:hypothetical protein
VNSLRDNNFRNGRLGKSARNLDLKNSNNWNKRYFLFVSNGLSSSSPEIHKFSRLFTCSNPFLSSQCIPWPRVQIRYRLDIGIADFTMPMILIDGEGVDCKVSMNNEWDTPEFVLKNEHWGTI